MKGIGGRRQPGNTKERKGRDRARRVSVRNRAITDSYLRGGAGPMGDRRTKRERTRGAQERAAKEEQE